MGSRWDYTPLPFRCEFLPTCLSWCYDKGAIKDPAHTGTSKGLSQAINGGPIRKFLPKYGNVYVTIQSHGLSAGVGTHYITDNGVRNGLSCSELLGAGPFDLTAVEIPAACRTWCQSRTVTSVTCKARVGFYGEIWVW